MRTFSSSLRALFNIPSCEKPSNTLKIEPSLSCSTALYIYASTLLRWCFPVCLSYNFETPRGRNYASFISPSLPPFVPSSLPFFLSLGGRGVIFIGQIKEPFSSCMCSPFLLSSLSCSQLEGSVD